MRGRRIVYSAREIAWIKRTCVRPRREAHAAFCRRFGREDVSLENFKSFCTRRGWKTGRTGYFPAGHVPHNRGQSMPYHPNSAKTRFHRGRLPHNTKYLGHERLSKDGYVEVSVDQQNPQTGFARRYVLKHRYLWEQRNGPLPHGRVLKCLDGNRRNTDPANWISIPRGWLPFLNGHRGPHYDQAAPVLKPIILTLAKLKHVRFSKELR